MKDSDVYIRAAQMIEDGTTKFSCTAVAWASEELFGRDGVRSFRVSEYARMFGFEHTHIRRDNEYELWELHDHDPERAKLMRVLMLCLMAAMVEEGIVYERICFTGLASGRTVRADQEGPAL